MNKSIGIIGTSSYVPDHKISTQQLFDLLNPNEKKRKIAKSLKIKTRAYESPIDPDTGLAEKNVDEVAIATKVVERALNSAGVEKEEVDLLELVSCTQDQKVNSHFSKTVMKLHDRLGLSNESDPFEMDAGCGGFTTALYRAMSILRGSEKDTAVVVASNITSKHLNAELYSNTKYAWLSPFVFGDGAGAMVLQEQTSKGEGGIIASYTAVNSEKNLMEYKVVPGAHEQVYEIQTSVGKTYSTLMQKALIGLSNEIDIPPQGLVEKADKLFCHQANTRLLDGFISELGIDQSKVPKNVDTAGNLAAATVPVLFDQASMSPGDFWIMLVVGAGAQIASACGRV